MIKRYFAHDVAQFAILASISSDQYKVALGFKQKPQEINVAFENLHACLHMSESMSQIHTCELELERFLVNESPFSFATLTMSTVEY